MKRWAMLVVAVGLFALSPLQAHAQAAFGPALAWGDDTDFGIGGRLDIPMGSALGVTDGSFSNIFFSGTFTYFFIDCRRCSYYEINGNLAVPFEIEGSSVGLYAGSGIRIGHVSRDLPEDNYSDTDVGLNLLGGLTFPLADELGGFVEGKFGLVGSGVSEQFVLSAGILFGG